MNITVLNGSPKGSRSITLQTILYLQKIYKNHSFNIIHVASGIKALEKAFESRNSHSDSSSAAEDNSPNAFYSAIKAIKESDLIIFSYPVYTFLLPSQLHRFIELMKESGEDFSGKYVTQLSTSKHFYDITAHSFVEENMKDLGMKYLTGLSADMEDLRSEKGRKQASDWLQYICWEMNFDGYKNTGSSFDFQKISDREIVIVTDCENDNHLLKNRIDSFRSRLSCRSKIVNIRDINMKGGCLGCFNCAATGNCIYTDNYAEVLRKEIQTADGTVYAFTIRDHSMGSLFKTFDDRQFCNGHRTVTMGSPVGYLVEGDMSCEPNLSLMLEARANVGGNFFAGIADADEKILHLASRMEYSLAKNYTPPQTFLGIGGMRIFRDLIYLMQGLMREDHKFFKSHGQYDFPQKRKGTIIAMYLVGKMFSNEKLRKKLGGKIDEGMLMPYKKVLDSIDDQKND